MEWRTSLELDQANQEIGDFVPALDLQVHLGNLGMTLRTGLVRFCTGVALDTNFWNIEV